MSHPGEKRFVTSADFVPVVAGHGGIPVEIAFEAPGLVVNLAPFFARIDLDFESAEIQLAGADFGFARNGIGDTEDRSGFVKNLCAVSIEVVAFDALEKDLVFAFGDVVDVEHVLWTLILCAELAGFLRRREVKELVFAGCQAVQNAGVDGGGGDAIAMPSRSISMGFTASGFFSSFCC